MIVVRFLESSSRPVSYTHLDVYKRQIVLLSVVTSMVGCNQTIAIMMTEQLGCVLYKEQENSQRAVDLEDSAVLISALIPWSIAGAVPAATIGAPVYCLAAACYLYLIPICRLVRKKNIFPGCNN